MSVESAPPAKPALTVLLVSPRGYCAGVERAIQIVEAALASRDDPIYVRHEIVHNRHVVEELEAKGAVFIDEISEVPDGAVVIFSAHGVPRSVVDETRDRKLEFLDATCPLVNKVHAEAASRVRQGYHVLLIGHAGHPEVEGTMGQVPAGSISLVETAADAERVAVPDDARVAYTTQTTLSVDDTAHIIAALKRRFPAIAGPNRSDICYATTNRQDAVKAIAPRADALLVIGAPNSSNSRRLVEVAASHGCARSILIERAGDLDWAFLDGIATLGITAGASAPEVLVQEVIDALRRRFDVTVEDVVVREENVVFSLPRALVG
ncbi:MAG: 4-hydroxy-3-methylbut-2-enyl diphosphate reductase [Alphaproteobacteria bacterium]|nr:4-hydroxy-3-methylbut-2-enyl diphosphate reductase [Alphaproteobacteria bacterium]